jgi:transcriptional regulator with PAS, ATPase and Fis domain
VDVRVIASTNKDPETAIRENHFREDLYYRLAVIRIELPPLRSRMEDLPALVQHFIEKLNKNSNRHVGGIATDAMESLSQYSWPGNVRELESVIESAFAMGTSEILRKNNLPAHIIRQVRIDPAGGVGGADVVPTLVEAERVLLAKALAAANGNKTLAAKLLGVSRPRLYKMMQRHAI